MDTSEAVQQLSGSTRSIFVTAIVSVFSTLVGAGAALGSQWMQGSRDLSTQCLAHVDKQEELVRTKAEAFLVAMSEELAFFQKHNEFEVAHAREKLADVQKAAFALSAYAGKDLSVKSFAIVSTTESAIVPTNDGDFRESLRRMVDVTAAWHPTYRNELEGFQDRRSQCQRSR